MNSPTPMYLRELGPGYLEYQLPISIKLVVDIDAHIPLLRNERDEWELPGGKLETGETPENTALRELAEEIGLDLPADTLHIIDTWVYEITPDRHVFIVSYGAIAPADLTTGVACSHEHKELALVPYRQVDTLTMPHQYKTTIARWRTHLYGG